MTTNEMVTAGWLHDIIEDTNVTAEDLGELGFSTEVIYAVLTVTRTDAETYTQFIDRITASGSDIAIAVKKADISDHLLDTTHISASLEKRYRKALAILTGA